MKLSSLLLLALLAAPSAQALEERVPSAAEVERLLRAGPKTYKAHFSAGRLYESQGLVGQAQDEYRLAIKCAAPQPDAYKRLAQLLLRSRDYGEAIKISTAATKLFPKDYGVWLTAGYVLQNADKIAPAYVFYEKARALKPEEPQTYIALADVCMVLDDKKKALNFINRGYKLAPPTVLMRFERAKVLMWLGKFDEAMVDLAANFKEDPINLGNNRMYSGLLLNQQQPQKALLVFLCLLPSVEGAEMAKTKYQIGFLVRTLPADKVKVEVDTALGLIHEPAKRAIVHFALGDVLDRLNRSPEAIHHYQAGIKDNPRFARGYLRLGEDLELVKKDYKGAMENYRKASALDKDGKDKEIPLRIKALQKKLKG